MRTRKIPLAWLQLKREKTRLLVALAGIAFANILMFMQLGFREALFESNVQFHNSLNGDIVLINPQSASLLSMETFSQRRLYQTLMLPEVESIHPIYIGFTNWKNPQTQKLRSIQVIGFMPDAVVNLPGVQQNLDKIKQQDVVLFDRGSREEFGTIATDFTAGRAIATEVGGRNIRVGGLFELGTSFGADGNLITSDLNFLRLFSGEGRQLGLIDLGLIKLKPGADPNAVAIKLRNYLSSQKDVRVFTKQEFVEFEKNYWANSTAIGFIFTLGTIMAFIVGTVIVYQILYSEIADHLPAYATLKAIGYTQFYLLIVVFQQALILATLGYLPGFAFAIFQYTMVRQETLLPIAMTTSRALMVLLLTILMCSVSGAIAIRKLRAADPADVFG